MHTILAKSTVAFVIVTLIVIINMGCSLSVLEQNREIATPTKPQESVFIVVDTADVEAPTLVGFCSVALSRRSEQQCCPFRAVRLCYDSTTSARR